MIVRWNQLPFKVSLGTLLLFGLLSYLVLYALQPPDEAKAAETLESPQPLQVETVTMLYEPLRSWTSYSGRIAAIDQASIRPLVSGTIQQVLFEDGAYVEAGDILFVIDPRPYEAAAKQASASLSSAQAALELARVEYERAQELARDNAISQSVLDQRRSNFTEATAALEAAQARLLSAELDLEYAHVRAPFSGRVGRAEVTVGNVVEAGGSAPVLTRIVSTDRLYAEFDVDETSYFNAIRSQQAMLEAHSDKLEELPAIPVNVTAGGVEYPATLHAFDNELNTQSGTVRARALIEQTDTALLPGSFAQVSLGTAGMEPTLLVPEQAIYPSQSKRFVYVVNDQGLAEYRELELGRSVDGRRVVLQGLQAGDQVIVNGLHRITANMPVIASRS